LGTSERAVGKTQIDEDASKQANITGGGNQRGKRGCGEGKFFLDDATSSHVHGIAKHVGGGSVRADARDSNVDH
jgi:hypothetical protein